MMAQSYGRVRTYAEWCQPRLVANAEELLRKELARMKAKPDEIHLCLATDPFMEGYPDVTSMSLKLVALINAHGIRCHMLTKGKMPVELADRKRFSADNLLGISLISLNEEFRKKWEPNAASYRERIGALKTLHELGGKAYVHIEPYPTPNLLQQDLTDLLQAVEFADKIYFGGWNYNAEVRKFPNYEEFYSNQRSLVGHFCRYRGILCD